MSEPDVVIGAGVTGPAVAALLRVGQDMPMSGDASGQARTAGSSRWLAGRRYRPDPAARRPAITKADVIIIVGTRLSVPDISDAVGCRVRTGRPDGSSSVPTDAVGTRLPAFPR